MVTRMSGLHVCSNAFFNSPKTNEKFRFFATGHCSGVCHGAAWCPLWSLRRCGMSPRHPPCSENVCGVFRKHKFHPTDHLGTTNPLEYSRLPVPKKTVFGSYKKKRCYMGANPSGLFKLRTPPSFRNLPLLTLSRQGIALSRRGSGRRPGRSFQSRR